MGQGETGRYGSAVSAAERKNLINDVCKFSRRRVAASPTPAISNPASVVFGRSWNLFFAKGKIYAI